MILKCYINEHSRMRVNTLNTTFAVFLVFITQMKEIKLVSVIVNKKRILYSYDFTIRCGNRKMYCVYFRGKERHIFQQSKKNF
jgi:hypothetical protein